MSRQVNWQRSFPILRKKLDLFLVKLTMESNQHRQFEAAFIFLHGKYYDVVVFGYGHQLYATQYEIEQFAKAL